MKAVWYERTGAAPEVLRLGEQPMPHARPGEVLVRLHASGVNPADCNRRAGRGHVMEFPLVIPNSDGSGVVQAVGEGVDAAWVGRRIWLYNGQRGRALGTAAQFIALDAGLVSPLPDAISFEEGACLGIPCMTAYRCVFMDGPVSGQTVLVQGGAGAVGHFAVQLAAWGAARVIATVSGEVKAAHARAGGAHAAIDRAREDVVAKVRELTDGRGVDRVIEVDFAANVDADVKMLRANGVIATYASPGATEARVPIRDLMRQNLSVHAVLLPGTPLASRQQAQRGIGEWLAGGKRMLTVSQVFDLDRTVDAHLAVEAGTKLGTVVVRCA